MTSATQPDRETDSYASHFVSALSNAVADKYELIMRNQNLREPSLLKTLAISSQLDLGFDRRSGEALFGYRSLKSDYRPASSNVCIEFKRIGLNCQRTRNGNFAIVPRDNECDLKNGLAQIIEQAYCKSATVAIFVVIDGGRACDRAWNEGEKQFIQMFKDNPFGITLSVIRIRLIHANRSIICETF